MLKREISIIGITFTISHVCCITIAISICSYYNAKNIGINTNISGTVYLTRVILLKHGYFPYMGLQFSVKIGNESFRTVVEFLKAVLSNFVKMDKFISQTVSISPVGNHIWISWCKYLTK